MLWTPPAPAVREARGDAGTKSLAPEDGCTIAKRRGPRPAAMPATPPPSRIVTLPGGLEVDLGVVAQGVAAILSAQGARLELDKKVHRVDFTDADLTLFDAPPTPVLLRHKETKALLLDPETGKPVRLGVGPTRDVRGEYMELKARRNDVDYGAYVPESPSYGILSSILGAKPIAPTVAALKAGKNDASTKQIIVTARGGGDEVIDGIKTYLKRAGLGLDGLFMMYRPDHQEHLQIGEAVPGQAQKKVVTMAGVLHLFGPAASKVQRVRFIDDNDENLRAAMEVLPGLFPQVRFEFVDVIHKGDGVFEHALVARSAKNGALEDAARKPIDLEAVRAYQSTDAPFTPAPEPIYFYLVDEANGHFSNFSPHPIELDGKLWPTSEHYFQAQKFEGTPHEELIRLAPTPKEAAAMGRDTSRPLRSDWESVKDEVMMRALRAKFTQHASLREALLGTGAADLVEHTEKDAYWGDGGDGLGKNRLGAILMTLRAELAAR